MFMLHRPFDVVHGCIGQATALEETLPLSRSFHHRLGFDEPYKFVAVSHSVVVREVFGVTLPFRSSQFVTEYAEQTIVGTADEDVAV